VNRIELRQSKIDKEIEALVQGMNDGVTELRGELRALDARVSRLSSAINDLKSTF
jgi:hypothetical protein